MSKKEFTAFFILAFCGGYLTVDEMTGARSVNAYLSDFNAALPLWPHGFCLAKSPLVVIGMIVSHITIAISYYTIPRTMGRIKARCVKRGVDIRAFEVFRLYMWFIRLCGLTHLAAIIVIYLALYEIYLAVLMACALVSVKTSMEIAKLEGVAVDFIIEFSGVKPAWVGSAKPKTSPYSYRQPSASLPSSAVR